MATTVGNYLTPEEAQSKFCPHMRVVPQETTSLGSRAGPAGNVFVDEKKETHFIHCIADACMMWRWWSSTGTGDRPAIGRCGLTTNLRFN